MRLDHLLSKEKEVGIVLLLSVQSKKKRIKKLMKNQEAYLECKITGGDALRGDTRSHPEHDG